jgi:hypothetical protein
MRRRPLVPAALLFALAVLAAAGAIVLAFSQPEPRHDALPAATPAAKPYAGLIGGVPLQSARCEQWLAGSGAERNKVAAALAHSVGGATPYGRGTTLSTGEAQALFDRACANPIAAHWLLYELYIRAAGFRSYVAPQT